VDCGLWSENGMNWLFWKTVILVDCELEK